MSYVYIILSGNGSDVYCHGVMCTVMGVMCTCMGMESVVSEVMSEHSIKGYDACCF